MSKEKFPRAYSALEIERYANCLCEFLGVGGEPYFNIVSVVENGLGLKLPGFSLQVLSQTDLGAIEAYTEFEPPRILAREDIYEGAYRDDTRSRFTIAHELGHLCLHWGFPRPRLALSALRTPRSRAEARVEDEANQFAGAFLIPRAVASQLSEPWRLARRCRVSDEAASKRLMGLSVQNDTLAKISVRTLFGINPEEA